MSDKYFVDTNILVYAYNADEKEKHARAVVRRYAQYSKYAHLIYEFPSNATCARALDAYVALLRPCFD